MTSPLAIQLMRFAFLALLWLFLFGMIRVIRMELRTAGAPRVQVPSKPKSKPKSKKARSAASDGRPGRGALSQLGTGGKAEDTRMRVTADTNARQLLRLRILIAVKMPVDDERVRKVLA